MEQPKTFSPVASLRATRSLSCFATRAPQRHSNASFTLERALAPRYLGWLAHENHSGANIYVAANPLLSGSRKRTKDCIASIRHLYIDIDVDGEARLAALRASELCRSRT